MPPWAEEMHARSGAWDGFPLPWMRAMKKTVFARPNLKVFLLGAIVIVAIQHMITNGLSQNPGAARPLAVYAREPMNVARDPELERILSQADQIPASQVCTQLSDYYTSRGEFRKALRYLRLANLFSESEQEAE
jgi:hypothetical protein